MPINYKDYHPMWKRISRFVRLIRAQNCCEKCGIENYTVRLYKDQVVVKQVDGFPDYTTARATATELYVEAESTAYGSQVYRATVVILTVAHLDHDTNNNELSNLKALCQGCHLGHDRRDNAQKRMYGRTGRYYKQLVLAL